MDDSLVDCWEYSMVGKSVEMRLVGCIWMVGLKVQSSVEKWESMKAEMLVLNLAVEKELSKVEQ
jgi:hypothetical protein